MGVCRVCLRGSNLTKNIFYFLTCPRLPPRLPPGFSAARCAPRCAPRRAPRSGSRRRGASSPLPRARPRSSQRSSIRARTTRKPCARGFLISKRCLVRACCCVWVFGGRPTPRSSHPPNKNTPNLRLFTRLPPYFPLLPLQASRPTASARSATSTTQPHTPGQRDAPARQAAYLRTGATLPGRTRLCSW